jgi:hypothetical protein
MDVADLLPYPLSTGLLVLIGGPECGKGTLGVGGSSAMISFVLVALS